MSVKITRQQWAWAFYDWANSAFATTVMAGFFPVFFKEYWSASADVTLSTLRLGATNSIASLIMAVMAPILGAIADRGGARKLYLIFFAMAAIIATTALPFVERQEWFLAALLYGVGILGFMGGNLFYDSLIIGVAPKSRFDCISALGFSLGYLGGGALFALNVVMVLKPALFGLADAAAAVKASILSVAIWWALFTLPLLLWVKEPPSFGVARGHSIRRGFSDLKESFTHIRQLRHIFTFLIAYFLYIDGVHTIIRMAVDYGMSLGFDSSSLMTALLVTQFVGFPATLLFGKLAGRIGVKRGLYLGIAVYCVVVIWGYLMDSVAEFYAIAILVGLAQGGVQALSRSFFAALIPEGHSAQFFGFYNMLGKFATVLGPVLMGAVAYLSGSPRASILSVLILLIGGGCLLARVKRPPVDGNVAAGV